MICEAFRRFGPESPFDDPFGHVRATARSFLGHTTRWTVDLRTLAGIYADGAAGVNAEAAKNARIGALVHAVDEAQRTLARFHKLATDADLATPHPRKRTAPADTADDDLPSLEKHPVRAPGEKNPGGAAG